MNVPGQPMWAGGAFRNWLSRPGETGLCALGTGIGQGVWVVGLLQTSSGVVAAESVQVTLVLCGRSIALALFGRYGPLLSGGLPLGPAAPIGLPVFLGAGGAAGSAGYGGIAATLASAKFLGLSSAFLRPEAMGLPASWGPVSLPVVLLAVLVLGLLYGRSLGFWWVACLGPRCGSGLCRFGGGCSGRLTLAGRVNWQRQCIFPFQGAPYYPLVRDGGE